MTSATEELRRMLDERGVEWWAEDDPEEPAYYFVTKWFANGCEQTYEEVPSIRRRSLKAYCVTTEQAIAATLGNTRAERTCEMEREQVGGCFTCSECGVLVLSARDPKFCPNCGARVKEVDA